MHNRATSDWKQYRYTEFIKCLALGNLPPNEKVFLNFASLSIDDTELIMLVEALQQYQPENEIKLHLQNNHIGIDGATELAKLLFANYIKIVEFNIDHNPIADEGVMAIFSAMLANTTVLKSHCLGASHEVYFIADMTIQACVMRNNLLKDHPEDAALILKAAEKMGFYEPGENPMDVEDLDWSPLKECFRLFSGYHQERAQRYREYEQMFLDYQAACTPGCHLSFMQEENTVPRA